MCMLGPLFPLYPAHRTPRSTLNTTNPPPKIHQNRYDFMPRNVSGLFFPPDANIHSGFFKVFYKVRRIFSCGVEQSSRHVHFYFGIRRHPFPFPLFPFSSDAPGVLTRNPENKTRNYTHKPIVDPQMKQKQHTAAGRPAHPPGADGHRPPPGHRHGCVQTHLYILLSQAIH